MARIRYLKPEFFSDEGLAELKYEARLTFAGLWCFADRAGRLEDRPKFLKAMIFPYDNIDIEKQLEALIYKPFIIRYEVDGKRYIEIVNWEKHQRPHNTEVESIFPPAPPFNKDKEKDKEKGVTQSASLNNILKYFKIFGEFNNVKLTEEEYNKLVIRFGEPVTKEKINNLSTYIASKGKKYSNHYATILAWDRKNKIEEPKTSW